MHYQTKPYEQGKLIRVISGEILDVIININRNSRLYLKKYYINLRENDQKLLWVPAGYAHGFLSKKMEPWFNTLQIIYTLKNTNVHLNGTIQI